MPPLAARLFPIEPAPFSLQILVDPEEAGSPGGPFVRLGADGGESKIFEARLTSPTGVVVEQLALRMPADSPSFPAGGDLSGRSETNEAVEECWAETLRQTLRTSAAPHRFPELLLPIPSDDRLAEILPPTLYAPSGNLFLRIPCPDCFGPLRTCRSDSDLAEAGLPPHSSSRERFLVCPRCRVEEGKRRFWTDRPVRGEGVGAGMVLGISDLRRELAASIEATRSRGERLPWPPEALESLLAVESPAATDRTAGWALGSRPSTPWLPFNFFDSPWIVTRQVPVSFDDFVDRLGGRVAPLRSGRADRGLGLFFGTEGSGLDVVEILTLKMTLFLQAVRCVRSLYDLVGTPHLDLEPSHLLVEPLPGGDEMPNLWNFRVKLLAHTASRSIRLPADGTAAGIEVVLPSSEPKLPFASPDAREFRIVPVRPAELTVERVVEEKDPSGRKLWRIEGRLTDRHGIYPVPRVRDLVLVGWQEGALGLSFQTAIFRPDPRVRSSSTSADLSLLSEPLDLDAASVEILARARGLRLPGARYKVYPLFGAPEDLHALGFLLFRILVVNDRQSLRVVEEVVDRVLRRMDSSEEMIGRGVAAEVADPLEVVFADSPTSFARVNLLHREADRIDARIALPEELWRECLRIAFRLVSRRRGFGYCTSASDFDPEFPAGRLGEVEADCEKVLARLRSVLFHRQPLNIEIQSVIEEMLAEEV
jgi:hypothetical protein